VQPMGAIGTIDWTRTSKSRMECKIFRERDRVRERSMGTITGKGEKR